MFVVAVTSRQISKRLTEENESLHVNVHDSLASIICSEWIEIGNFSTQIWQKVTFVIQIGFVPSLCKLYIHTGFYRAAWNAEAV